MSAATLQSLMQVLIEQQLNAAAAGIFLAFFLWALLRLISRQNSGTRFALWFSTLLAIVVLPFFSTSVLNFSHLHAPIAHSRGEIVLASSWAVYLFAVWATCAVVLLLRLCVGLWRVRSIRRNCIEVDVTSIDPTIEGILQTSKIGRAHV